MNKLNLSNSLSLPLEAVTKTFGILAVRGAGKSNLAAVMAEEMFRNELPFVVIDPVSCWWGLRSDADGQRPGLAIPVFGGKHGDVPLARESGALVADMVVADRLSCVLDVFEFSKGDRIRFLIDFAERLYRTNSEPLHLFLEEADDYIPQRTFRDTARMLGAFEDIVRRGRAKGLGITLITQRSASINKNVLTQVETLFALRTTSPQDRKAVAAWVEYNAQDEKLLETLPDLKDGEAWVWSPWLKVFERAKIRRRQTYDSAATPSAKARRAPTKLADVDLDAVKQKMASVIERAKTEDPRELRKTISDLRSELKRVGAVKQAPVRQTTVEVPVLGKGMAARLERAIERLRNGIAAYVRTSEKMRERMQVVSADLGEVAQLIDAGHKSNRMRAIAGSTDVETGEPPRGVVSAEAIHHMRSASPHSRSEDAVQERIIQTIAMLETRGIEPDRTRIARWMGIHPDGGRYRDNLKQLREAKILRDDYRLHETPAFGGRTGIYGAEDALKDEAQRTMLKTIAAHPQGFPSRVELAEALGIHPDGGRFRDNLKHLREMALIPERNPIVLTAEARR